MTNPENYKLTDGAVIGYGVVGKSTAQLFGIDDYFDLNGSTMSLEEIAKTKRFVFLCLPTPSGEYGHEMQSLFEMIKQLNQLGKGLIYVVRSTVTPGFAGRIKNELHIDSLVSNPEFLTMSTAQQDTFNPDIIVVGGLPQYTKAVVELYTNALGTKIIDEGKVFITDNITAETIKVAINNFYALKVIFANQYYDLCSLLGADYDLLKEALYKRKWIGNNHLEVIFNGKRGVGGACLKKDLEAMNRAFHMPIMEMAERINKTLGA